MYSSRLLSHNGYSSWHGQCTNKVVWLINKNKTKIKLVNFFLLRFCNNKNLYNYSSIMHNIYIKQIKITFNNLKIIQLNSNELMRHAAVKYVSFVFFFL